MEISVERIESWKIALRVKSDSVPVEQEMERLFGAYTSGAEIPGFRKGKAPRELVRARYGKAVESKALEKTIPVVYREALEQEGMNPLTQAEIDEVDFEPGRQLSFRATFEVVPDIEVKEYDGLPVATTDTTPSEEEVAERLELLRQMNASLSPVEREARTGDHLVVDYTVLDGKGQEIPDGRVSNYSLPLGDIGQKELDEGLIGVKAGDVKEVRVSFPREVKDKRVAGKTLPVRMKIREVKERKVSELNEEFAKDLGADSLSGLKVKVSDELAQEARRRARASMEKEVIDRLIERNSFDPPKSMVDGYMEELRLGTRELGVWFARRAILLDKLIETLEVVVLDKETDERVRKIAEELRADPVKMRESLERTGRIEHVKASIRREKALDYLIEHAVKT